MNHPELETTTEGLFEPEITFEESQNIYKQWALDKTYDEMINDSTVYTAPPRLTAKMVELFPERDGTLVLDIGAGTGIIAERLLEVGFPNIDGLEPLQEFVTVAEEKKIYRKFFPQPIGGGSVVDVPDDTYDAVVSAGAFGPGSIPSDSFNEIIRVIKNGGYFINCMRHSYLSTAPIYKDKLEPLAEQLEAAGKWEKVTWETYDNHYMGNEGILMVFRVLKSS